jgi:soluble lytic murein transglycosylase-like protein
MKFTKVALLLGCAVIALPFLPESKFLSARLPIVGRYFQILTKTAGQWFPCLEPQRFALSLPTSPENKTAAVPAVPSLSKAETLMLIADAAAKYQVPQAFVTSIVAAESNFDCGAISQRGAIGLMQLMPETAQQFSADPSVPAQNIDAGTRYLRWLIDRYRSSSNSIKRVIAAYNAGPGMVDRYRGVPPFPETRNYVVRVLGFMKQYAPPQKHEVARHGRHRQTRDEWAELLASAASPRNTD